MSPAEHEAAAAVQAALRAIEIALRRCSDAGYGNAHVIGPLHEAAATVEAVQRTVLA